MLELVIGSTGVSLGILLGTFMAGLCLGSLFRVKKVARKTRKPAAKKVVKKTAK